MGPEGEIEPSEADMDAAGEAKSAAAEAVEKGDYAAAVQFYTKAIKASLGLALRLAEVSFMQLTAAGSIVYFREACINPERLA